MKNKSAHPSFKEAKIALLLLMAVTFLSCGTVARTPASRDFSTLERNIESSRHQRKIIESSGGAGEVARGFMVPVYFKAFD